MKVILLNVIFSYFSLIYCKYIEGDLHTNNDWVFLARFCFLSEFGQFEYHLEFNEEIGIPNLLLYYDTKDQWPAIYKSSLMKSCWEKESVLHIEQNQIVNLTISGSSKMKEFSGCFLTKKNNLIPTTSSPKYSIKLPTKKVSKRTTTTTTTTTQTTLMTTTNDFQDENTIVTTTTPLNYNTTIFEKEIEIFSPSLVYKLNKPIPIKKRSTIIQQKNRTIICQSTRRFRSSRERWWFIAISNCNNTKGIKLKYKLLMTNGPPGDYWHEHFSADEFYILPILMIFTMVYSFLMLTVIICSLELKTRQLLHATYKIYCFSVLLHMFGVLINCVTYLKYAVNGINNVTFKRISGILMGASEILFLIMLILMAKGYTITRGRLSVKTSIKLTIFICLYVVTYITLFIYEAKVFDPGEVLYLYESPAGYGIIILRFCAWFIFIYSIIITLKRYPEKSNFYYSFNICGTIWFLTGPIFIFIANNYIDKWIRESIVCCLIQFITFGGHLSFLILTLPSLANKTFPYHVRTTQIDIMNDDRLENFQHHIYEPSNTSSSTMIIPLSSSSSSSSENTTNYGDLENIFGNRKLYQQKSFIENSIGDVPFWALAKNLNGQSFIGKRPPLPPAIERINSHKSTIMDEEYITNVPFELFTINRTIIQSDEQNKDK